MNNYTSFFSLLMLASSLSLHGADLAVSVQIDGHSHLVIRTNEILWNHFYGGRPGTFGVNEPTLLNSYQWFPTWPDTPNGTPGGSSRLAASVRFQTNGPITLDQQAGRTGVTIYQQPLAENEYTLVVDFDDTAPGGADYYAVTLHGVTFSLSLRLRIYVSAVNVVWATETNKTYQLQSAASPFATDWRDAGPPVSGDGMDFTFTDQVAENSRRFYRVTANPQP